ncbi:MAG: GHKL domain-containing protein [Eubacterium sp.]
MDMLMINVFRGGVTAVMNVLLLFTLAQPKYGKRVTITAAVVVFLLDLVTSILFYQSGNLTALVQFDVVFLLAVGVLLKPLMRDSLMQWCFNFLTAVNVYAIVVVLSYHLCDFFPNPYYANSFLRFFLYLLLILAFRHYLKPLYQRVAENWSAFFVLAICVFLNFAYYFVCTEDVEQTLTDTMWPMLLLIGLTLAVYGTVFFFLKKTLRTHALREENLKMKNDAQLLQLSVNAMAQRLELMDEVTQQNSRASHDRRHFNNMLLELLEMGESQSAIDLLKKQTRLVPKVSCVYCENNTVNATVSHYAGFAEQSGILTRIELDIPNDLAVDALELSMVIANLLENAILACCNLPKEREKQIKFVCCNAGRLLLEIENPCGPDVGLDENGYPVAQEEGHGIGSKSVIAFTKKYEGELIYNIQNGRFCVRLLV